jgi:uncharacterized protein (TIGR02246 family)
MAVPHETRSFILMPRTREDHNGIASTCMIPTEPGLLRCVRASARRVAGAGGRCEGQRRVSDSEVEAIKSLYVENAAALNAGDLPALASFYTDDAIHLPPNSPAIAGKEAILKQLKKELSEFGVEASVRVVEIEVAGPWAFARGTYSMKATRKTEGSPIEETGKWLDILRRQGDGSWKISHATWTSDAPPR